MIKNYTEEEVLQAQNSAPEAIRDALSGDILLDFIIGLRSNYDLHVDTVGKVTEMIRNTLLGLMNPSEFFSGLLELGISSETAKKLTNDLNTIVFIPLHKEIVGEANIPANSIASAPSYTAPITPSVSEFKKIEPVVPEIIPPVQTVQQIPVPTYVMPPVTPQPTATPFQPVVSQSAPIAAPAPEIGEETSTSAIEAEISAPQTPVVASAPVPAPITPAPQTPAYVPPPSVTASFTSTSAAPETPTTPNASTQSDVNREALGKIMKEYGVDPYREPVDEK